MDSFTLVDKDGNSVYLGDYGVYIGSTDRGLNVDSFIPGVENNVVTDVSHMNGGYFFNQKLQPRELVIKCYVENATQYEANQIAQILYCSTPHEIIFDTSPHKFIWAVSNDDVDFNNIYYGDSYSGLFEVSYIAYEPLFYSVFTSLNINSYLNDNINTDKFLDINNGLPYTEDITPASFANVSGSSTFTLYNGGNYRTKMTITMDGSLTNATFTNNQNGLNFTISSISSEEIVVDGVRGQVRDDSGLRSSIFSDDGDFITLEPGVNDITVIGDSIELTSISFDYRYAYLQKI